MNYKDITEEIISYKDPERAKSSEWFFKTKKGQYGAGDKFLGLRVPLQRSIAKKYFKELDFYEVEELQKSKYHEFRLIAVFILVYKYQRVKTDEEKKEIFDFYIKNRKYVNNWDIVDSSAGHIVGEYLKDKEDRSVLYELAESEVLWDNRIAIIANWNLVKDNQFEDLINLSVKLLNHPHDLMHKAIGWMLREMGKKDEKELINFLDKHATKMPRTMLRYSIEKFDEPTRQNYLKDLI